MAFDPSHFLRTWRSVMRRALTTAGSSMEDRMPMIAIVTMVSVAVKPRMPSFFLRARIFTLMSFDALHYNIFGKNVSH